MKEITLEALLEAGCHFGHQVTRHNPKARDYIFEARDNIHIIDLAKTKEGLEEAAKYISHKASQGGNLLVVGTKRQAQGIVKRELERAQQAGATGIYSITDHWIGGILTNFSEVTKNVKKLKDLTAKLQDESEKAKYTKREVGQWEKDRQKLESLYGGVSEMKQIPDVLFIIDTHLEHLAVKESKRMRVPTVGITDTNADPHIIDYPIPANDDAVGSLDIVITYIFDAWIEGKTKKQETQAPKETKETEKSQEEAQKPKEKKVAKKKTTKKVKKAQEETAS